VSRPHTLSKAVFGRISSRRAQKEFTGRRFVVSLKSDDGKQQDFSSHALEGREDTSTTEKLSQLPR
jgi:hypothetical protein